MDPVRELPYWPAAMALLIEAGQMTASDYVPTYPNLSLAFEGASTDAKPVIQDTTTLRTLDDTRSIIVFAFKQRDLELPFMTKMPPFCPETLLKRS